MRTTIPALAAMGALALTGCAEDPSGPDLGTHGLSVRVVPGGADCASLGIGTHELRIESPVDGWYQLDAGNRLLFRYYNDTHTVFFYTQSSLRLDGVLVHSGTDTTVWELNEANGWPSLGALDQVNGGYAPTDAVSFCWDYELFLNPNAYAKYRGQQEWDIAKTGLDVALTLAEGQTYVADYTVTVAPSTVTTVHQYIDGPVFINNPTPYTPTIDAVTVMVGELAATVTCPVTFPYVMPAFRTLTCNWRVDVPDTADRLVYVDVVSDGSVAVDRSLEIASFAKHTTQSVLVDTCVDVFDDHVAGELLGTTCASDGPRTFSYSAEVGPFAVCGPFEVVNTAWYVGKSTGASEAATWTVGGEVPCATGCSLTPGYWKTHSEYGPAPYDGTWAQLPQGADTPFFASGGSYYGVLWTSPAGGNAYYILAHAYIAAALNRLNGADFAAAQDAFDAATALFQAYGPSSAALGKKGFARSQAIALAETLDRYNNGLIGPGHCDE